MTKVFIDGEAGTTGLQIRERLAARDDVSLVSLDDARRKDRTARMEAFEEADVAILCLPDEAAREAVTLAGDCRLIDASTAHRTAPGWVYGMPELPGAREAIRSARRVANVGCYATGAIACIRPLRDAGLIPQDARLTLTGVSGYSGGGKALIAQYAAGTAPAHYLYGLTQAHKHLPEIMLRAGLEVAPLFTPAVGSFAQGMAVMLHVTADALPGAPEQEEAEAALRVFYRGDPFVSVVEPGARIEPESLNGTNEMHVSVQGDGALRYTVAAVLDNLGKGASGTAVQNLNLMIGAPERAGLVPEAATVP
jgi:N-acetyl-gamma-glutamyl-phosphate reductase